MINKETTAVADRPYSKQQQRQQRIESTIITRQPRNRIPARLWNGTGYVQDASDFDRVLIEAWEDRFAGGLFRYDVTAVLTRLIEGPSRYVAQYNEGRATKKRQTEFKMDLVCQEFDGKKFNFTKADQKEVLFTFEEQDEDEEEN